LRAAKEAWPRKKTKKNQTLSEIFMNDKNGSSVLCHLGETYSKAYEFFYEDIAPHIVQVRAMLTA
jgi:hypothetical protein